MDFNEKIKRKNNLDNKLKYKRLRRNGISRRGDPIRSRCDDWKCIEFRKLREIE